MHIGFLTPEYPHPKVKHCAGIGSSLYNLVVALLQENIQVSVFIYGQDTDFTISEENLQLYGFEQKSYPYGGFYLYRKYLNRKINNLITSGNIDLLEVPDWTGISAFMKFKVPVVMRLHGSDTYFCHLEKRSQKIKNRFFEKLAAAGAQAYIAPTTFAGNLSAELLQINKEKVRTIHYGLNLEDFRNVKPELFERNTVLYIGTLVRKKGVLELPEIFQKVKEQCPAAKLVLIGPDSADKLSGSNSTWELLLKDFDANLKDSIEYLGKLPYSEVKAAIQKAHVCIFPSYAETLGMVTIEAMALQKAVVNTSIGWAEELIDDAQNGFLVHPSNHEGFAAAILKLFKDEDYAKKIGEKAREKVEQSFNMDNIVRQNIEFYKSVLTPAKK